MVYIFPFCQLNNKERQVRHNPTRRDSLTLTPAAYNPRHLTAP